MALTDGCRAWWNFNVPDGTDSSGNGNILAANSNIYIANVNGLIGKGASITTANFGSMASSAALSFGTGAMSMSMFVNLAGLGAGTVEGLVAKGLGAADREYQFYHGANIVTRFYTGTTTHYIGSVTIDSPLGAGAAGTWKHIVITKPANTDQAQIKTYVDSVLQNVTPASGGTYAGMTTSTGVLNIGSSLAPATQRSNGTYDLIGFWNRELTQDEINQLYNNRNGLDIFAAPAFNPKAGAMFQFF